MRRLAIIGTGLIGASVALAAKRAGRTEVVGYDPEPEALASAVERGAVDRRAGSLDLAVAEAELAIVAAPVTSGLPASRGRFTRSIPTSAMSFAVVAAA